MAARILKYAILLAAVLLVGTARAGAADDTKNGEPQKPKVFRILDNMGFENKPDTTPIGMVPCRIIYDGYIWHDKSKIGTMPDEGTYKALVKAHYSEPGPVVIDIETVPLTGDAAKVEARFAMFMNLVQWTHEASPGSLVGFYGEGSIFPREPDKKFAAQTKALAKAVDLFCPSMYTMDDNRAKWKAKLAGFVKEARGIAPEKPICPYIWPQYHGGSHKFISGDYWSYQLQTARDCGCNGVVIWSMTKPAWDADAAWWQATVKFAGELKKS